MYEMSYYFEWASDTCLWSTNKVADDKFGLCVDFKKLPISDKLVKELGQLCIRHDTALNWDDPASGLIWSEDDVKDFLKAAHNSYINLCNELGSDFYIEYAINNSMYK